MDENLEPTNEYTLDPSHQAHTDALQERADYWENKEEQDSIENAEAAAKAKEQEKLDNRWAIHKAAHGIAETAAQPVLGVADFASDAVGLVPWLKPVDDWWDNNSPRATHPGHKLLRNASSIIIPTLAGGSWIVGGAKAAGAARAITLPKYAQTLGAIAAYTGVDTGVAMISSHSKTDDNMAGTLNNWLGWNIPWATRAGDDPDTRWKKNVFEAAGFAGSVELLGAALTYGKKAKLFPRDAAAEELINQKNVQLELFDDPLTAAVEPRRVAREAAQDEEMIEALKADPAGEEGYNAFVNDIGEDTAGKAVMNLEADPLEAKLHHAQMQSNVGSLNGRAAPVADEAFTKAFAKAIDGNERAQKLDDLFNRISPNFDAVVTNGAQPVRITAEEMNRSVDNLTQAIYGRDISFKEFEFIVDDMKSTIFNSNSFLDEESWVVASNAFKQAYDTLFDPNQMRASAMLTQQTADNITDAATAAKMLGDSSDTSRQFRIMFDKLNLLDNEVRANDFIMKKALEYKKLIKTGNVDATVSWMNTQAKDFSRQLRRVRNNNSKFSDELFRIARQDPQYFRPLKEAFYATNGSVDELHKLKNVANDNISLIKKGFLDGNPEMPSLLVKQLHATRINSVLSGLSPLRALVGNSMLTFTKPISVMVGAKLTGNQAVFKRAQATFGGLGENFKRGLKVMQREWNLANQFPEEAMMRGRSDLRMAKMDKLDYMESMAEVWRKDGELGKLAMWNMTKGLTWWNKQPFVRYGTNALYAIDGMTNSFMASGMARARAYDELFDITKGGVDFDEFTKRQRVLYDEAFDSTGRLTDEAAKMASREIALNLDNKIVKQFEDFLDHVPVAKPLFLFPRTGVNALELGWSFNPASALGPALTKARRALGAKTKAEKLAVLAEHGIDSTQNADLAFQTLKSEYLGRQIMGSTVVMGVGLWAMEGNLTGAGPQDDAERRRMMSMGWKPWSIKNPITGEWRSYQGFEPFDKLMGLTADVVYQANRVDQSLTEDWFRKIAFSISMNMTNSTFISGFEPLVGLMSGDAGAWTKFFAQQTDMMIPYKGTRTILNNVVSPQLLEVNNDYTSYMMNANKFLFSGAENLKDMVDIYTGKPIKYYDPLTNAANAVLPMFKSNGGMEPWRQWLLSTGWDGLQKIRRDPDTKQPLTSRQKNWMNNWIAKNADLQTQVTDLMTKNDGYYQKKMKEYAKLRGNQTQADFPIKKWIVHQELDRIHDRAFRAAQNAWRHYNNQFTTIGREMKTRDLYLKKGQGKKALQKAEKVKTLLDY